ncbi:MAG: mechanosensitive ion channel family protein [Thermodesulfobacteriota bacterium]
MEVIIQWLQQMEIAPIVGGVLIAVATIIAATVIRFLGDKGALALSRWSGLGIRTQLFDIIRWPLWISVLLVGVLVEVQWLMPPPPIAFLVAGAAQTALVIVWMVPLGKTLKLVCSRLGGYYPGASELLLLTENVGIAVIAIVGGLAVLTVWHVNLTPLLASAGLAGIIIALAAKDVLGNFFGGISVFLDRPFRPGDYIVLGSGERGKVVHIGLRSTRILTRDDVLVSIPNSVIVSTKIVNESAPERRMRVRIKVSVAYSSDVDKVEEILLKVAEANSLVLPAPEPRVRFRAFGDWSLDFELLCWVAQPKDKGLLVHELNSAIFKEFNRAGVVFPMPQRDVYIHQVSAEATKQDRHLLS